jgi:ABC-2 type transport system ATP-binding protein
MPADAGRARVAGLDVFTRSQDVRRRIGYLPESTPLYGEMRVREYLRFRARLKGVPGAELARRIDHVAGLCWLQEFINRPIGHLSKGMRQRVGLADTLIHEPQIIFLDEPTIGLDPGQIRKTRELISELGQRRTIMLSTHILSDVEALCSQVIIIKGGRVVAQGHPQDLSARLSASSKVIAEIRAGGGAVEPTLLQLAGIRGVNREEHDGWSRLRIECDPQIDVRPAVAELAARQGWVLRELRREVGSLEDYFVRIVAGEGRENAAPAES